MTNLIVLSRKINQLSGIFLLSLVLTLLITANSCKRSPHWQADISRVNIEPVEIKRYEQVLFNINPHNIVEEVEPHMEEFSLFLGDAIYTEMGQIQLYDYITDDFIQEVWEDTREVWEEVSALEDELTQGFRYFRYHYPQRPLPVFYSYISGLDFDYPVKYFENNIIIGLDMFLGKDYLNYERIGIPAFKRNRFVPQGASVEVMRAMAEEMLRQSGITPETFLDYMMHEGKILYFIDCMLPDYSDTLKITYSKEQMEWASRNQGYAWTFYLDNEMLYSTDRQLIQKFFGSGPFTAPFSRGSAPQMGVFNGWMVVREYMRRNPEVSLEELMRTSDSRLILNQARYRP